MADRMHDWIMSGERPLPAFVTPFAKAASGSSKADDEDDDDEDDDEDDDDEDDDDLADLSEDDLRAELRKTRESLNRSASGSKAKRDRIKKLNRELEEARKPKPAAKKKAADDDDAPDLDVIRHEAKTEGEKAGVTRAKRAEAKASLLGAGANPERVAKAIGLLDLDDLDLDDDGLDGIDDAIEDLRKEWPELFAKKRQKRQSVAGDGDRDGDTTRRTPQRQGKTASQIAADRILSRS